MTLFQIENLILSRGHEFALNDSYANLIQTLP